MIRSLYAGWLALALCALAMPVAQAQTLYSIDTLGLFPGGYLPSALSLNANGQITGQIFASSGHYQAMRVAPNASLANAAALGVLPGYTRSFGASINAAGQVAGFSETSDIQGPGDQIRAFRTSATGLVSDAGTDLGVLLGYTSSHAWSINASGQVTGDSSKYDPVANNYPTHAFRASATGLISDPGTDLGDSGGGFSHGQSINASGQVTGYSLTGTGDVHAFRTSATGLISDLGTDLGTPAGAGDSFGTSINDSGQVAGYSVDNNGSGYARAFRVSATGLISDPGADLGTLGGNESIANAINNAGYVVGTASLADGNYDAFLYTDRILDLNTLLSSSDQLQWSLYEAFAINDRGQILVDATFLDGNDYAILLTPMATPEPGAMALFLAMACCGGRLLARRRKQAYK